MSEQSRLYEIGIIKINIGDLIAVLRLLKLKPKCWALRVYSWKSELD